MTQIKDYKLLLYSDDLKIIREVNNITDNHILQDGFDKNHLLVFKLQHDG